MIVLIKNSAIHSTYREIPIETLAELVAQDFSVLEIPDDNSISLIIGEKSPVDQDISATLKTAIRFNTARLKRKIKEQIGTKWNDLLIKTEAETVTKLETARQQLEKNNISSVPWRFDDGNFRELTVNQLDDLIRVVSQAVQKNFLDERNEVTS